MTLVQVLANETSVHVACDFRLTDPYTGKVVHDDAHKLVSVNSFSFSALVGVTGVAMLDKKPIGQWIAETVAESGTDASVDDVLEALRRADTPLAQISDPRVRRHTFVVAAIIGSQSLVALVSNFEAFVKGQIERAATADVAMTISRDRPKSERLFVTGVPDAVTREEHEKLELSLRAGRPDAQIQEQLSQINVAASGRTDKVSAGCHVGSLHATGTGSSRPFLTEEQKGDFITPEFANLMKQLGIEFRREIGPDGQALPIRMVGATSVRSEASPEYFREQFKLRPNSAELWNNYGAFLANRRQHEKAIDAYRKAMALDPSYAIAFANLAKEMWLHRGDATQADHLYAEAVAKTEPTVPAWILSDFAVLCDEGLGDAKRAAELHERAVQDQNLPLAQARHALFMLKNGNDPARANALLTQVLDKHPEDAQVLVVAGQADWFYNRKPQPALAKLHKACSLDSSNANALRLTADVSLVMGDPASAAYYYRKAMKRGASGPQVRGNYGLALLMNRKPQGAFRQLSQAARAAPHDTAIQTNLAAALWTLRRRDQSVGLMHEILELSPPPQIELEVLAMLQLAAPSSVKDTTERIRALVESGVRADGNTIRCMVRDRPGSERQEGYRLADIIEATTSLT